EPRAALRGWFEPRRSLYPWRGERDPYRVLVSEVMLQQTQATRVAASYLAFVERFPSVSALAAASRADVLRAWAGLGYNRRPAPRCDACPLAGWCRFRLAGRRPTPRRRRGAGFEGSTRQVRGRVVALLLLLHTKSATLGALAGEAGVPLERVAEAVRGLSRD